MILVFTNVHAFTKIFQIKNFDKTPGRKRNVTDILYLAEKFEPSNLAEIKTELQNVHLTNPVSCLWTELFLTARRLSAEMRSWAGLERT